MRELTFLKLWALLQTKGTSQMKIKTVLISSFFVFAMALTSLDAQALVRHCSKGQPCGNSCISKNDICHITNIGNAQSAPAASGIETKTTAPASPAAAAPAATAAPVSAAVPANATKTKNCKKGKPCGNSCIAEKAVCHAK
ncbi:MAG: hypothetical protein H7333_03780 [Bdellovibrionales bacterium]|nr:hypothetical protein [Oligoflexia bacterium]